MDEEQQYWCLLSTVLFTLGSGVVFIYCQYKDMSFLEFITGQFEFPQIGDTPENPLDDYSNYTNQIPRNNHSVPLGDGIQEPLASFFGQD